MSYHMTATASKHIIRVRRPEPGGRGQEAPPVGWSNNLCMYMYVCMYVYIYIYTHNDYTCIHITYTIYIYIYMCYAMYHTIFDLNNLNFIIYMNLKHNS